MIKYAHIGYAKSASSWLQTNLFPKHKDLFHLGRSLGFGKERENFDDTIRLFLWNDIINTPSFLWNGKKIRDTLTQYFDLAEKRRVIACGISQEMITNVLTGKIDLTERANRLCEVFGFDTKIIIVIRNQFSWIESLYKGMLKEGGLTLTYEEFLFYLYYEKDISPLYTLFYDRVYEYYAGLFGANNIHVVPFEIIKKYGIESFAEAVTTAIGVSPIENINKNKINDSPSPQILNLIYLFNNNQRYYMGGDYFEQLWGINILPLYDRLSVEPPKRIITSRKNYHFASSDIPNIQYKNLKEQIRIILKIYNVDKPNWDIFKYIEVIKCFFRLRMNKIAALNTTMPATYKELLHKEFAPHNNRLQKLLKINLEEFNYPL